MKTIAREEILRLNCPGFGEESDLSIGNARALDTYKVIIINPMSILHLFDRGSDNLKAIDAAIKDGLTSYVLPTDELLINLNDEAIQRTEELVKFLEEGGLLIYYLCRPFVLQGTSINMDNYFWLLTLAPDKVSSSEISQNRNMSAVAHGRNVETTPEAEDSEFYSYFKQQGLEWSTIIRTEFLMEGYTALALAGTKKVIAAELFAGDNGGRVVFLPAPYSPDFDRAAIECANLWYNRKLGSGESEAEIKEVIDEALDREADQPTERVKAKQVETVKEGLATKEKEEAEKLSKELADTEREIFSQSHHRMQAAKAPTPSSNSSNNIAALLGGSIATVPKEVSKEVTPPPKPPVSTGENGPSKAALQKTGSGLVLPKLDKSMNDAPPTSTTSGAKSPSSSLQNLLRDRSDDSHDEDYELEAAPDPAPKPNSKTTAPLPASEIASKREEVASASIAENLLKELEGISQNGAPENSELEPEPEREAEALIEEPEAEPEVEPELEVEAEPELEMQEETEPEPEPEPISHKVEVEQEEEEPMAEIETQTKPTPRTTPLPKPTATQQLRASQPVSTASRVESKTGNAPEWCQNFAFPGLETIKSERGTLHEQIRQLQSRINAIDERISGLDDLKNALLSSEGEELIDHCDHALTRLGWTVSKSDHADELWLSDNDEWEAVIRIARSPKQARRTDLAHLIEGCTKFWEKKDVDPKGILLTSTWTEGKSPEAEYPQQLADHATKHGLCLMTTSQVLAAVRDVELGKSSGADIRKKILENSGPTKGLTL